MKRLRSDLFDSLHDDIVIYILCKLSSTASCPSDFISVLLTCKRLNKVGLNPLVLSKSCSKVLAVRAKNWSDEAHRFMMLCVNAGNLEAYYTLGMIRFYCLQNPRNGASLLAKAAIKSHAPALYSLGVIQFNGSGGLKKKDLRAGAALCSRAAFLGHIDALREVGHCFQDGYGVRMNVTEGRRLLVQANAREVARVFSNPSFPHLSELPLLVRIPTGAPNQISFRSDLFSDFGFYFNMITGDVHPVNKFMLEWFGLNDGNALGEGLRLCSYVGCGRPETRRDEFRRCSGCGCVSYCSRGCQANDWRVRHKTDCSPIEGIDYVEEDFVDGGDAVVDDRMVEIEEIQI